MTSNVTIAENHTESFNGSSESTLAAVFNICTHGLIVLNSSLRIVDWNNWIAEHSNISRQQALGKPLESIFPALKNNNLFNAVHDALSNQNSSTISWTLNHNPITLSDHGNNAISQNIAVKPLHREGHEPMCLIQVSDVSEAVKREHQFQEQASRLEDLANKLRKEKELAQITLQAIADAVITTDSSAQIMSMNNVAEKLTGWSSESALNKKVSQIFSVFQENSQTQVPNPVTRCLEELSVVSNDQNLILIDKSGGEHAITESAAPILGDNDELIGAILVFRDVTDSRELAAKLNWQAKHDPLTGLANRRAFEEELTRLLDDARSTKTTHSLLYIDLDQFKVVNDTCGHTAGDELLRQLSPIFQRQIRHNDTLARLGGDEFCVLLEGCGKNNALRLAKLLRQEIQEFRFAWRDKTFVLGLSIGLVEFDGTEKDAAEILSAADSACYVAKDTGRNRVQIHSKDKDKASTHQQEMQWISRLQYALDQNRFCLYVQRITNIQNLDARQNHYEVLIRMLDDNDNLIPPGAFIPAAERFNLMHNIDRWVIRTLFEKLASTYQNNFDSLPVFSINLSGTSINDETFLTDLQELLHRTRIPANRLCFEITETAAIANLSKAVHFITELKNEGCHFSLDDFGSGLSSFAYLKNLPVDSLKIDGHFVKDICHDPIDRAFVESINQIGHVMGLTTIAEFVENEIILETLKEIGVDFAQGYGIEMPIPFSELKLP